MTAAFGVQAKESRYIGGRTALARRIPPKKKNIERPEGDVVYYSMKNLRGRIGSTRHLMRGLGCNADSSTTFGGGETQHENAKASKVGGPMKSAPPCLQSLL
jgi:hypothetical protein